MESTIQQVHHKSKCWDVFSMPKCTKAKKVITDYNNVVNQQEFDLQAYEDGQKFILPQRRESATYMSSYKLGAMGRAPWDSMTVRDFNL